MMGNGGLNNFRGVTLLATPKVTPTRNLNTVTHIYSSRQSMWLPQNKIKMLQFSLKSRDYVV